MSAAPFPASGNIAVDDKFEGKTSGFSIKWRKSYRDDYHCDYRLLRHDAATMQRRIATTMPIINT